MGYCKEFNYIFTNVHITPRQKTMHRIEKYLSLVQGLGIEAYYKKPVFSVPEQDNNYIDDFILKNHLGQKSMAIIHPGTSLFGKYKRWPTEKYARLSDKLIEDFGYAVIFTWSGPEYNIAEDIRSHMHFPGDNCMQDRIGETVGCVIATCGYLYWRGYRAYPSCIMPWDSYNSSFGPKDPVVYAPFDENASVVRKDIHCSPCEKRRCEHVTCIHSITPDDVYSEICKLRKKRGLTF